MGKNGDEQGRARRIKGEAIKWEMWKEICRLVYGNERLNPDEVIKAATLLEEET